MSAERIELVAKRIWFYSEHDEAAFFAWLDKVPCIVGYRGEGDILYIDTRSKIADASLRELLALFYRYGIDMKQLLVFEGEANRRWFSDPDSYWFNQVYGEPHLK